tara:strand:- start:765 stop:1055 length:291 start_codon:yes stop_codon:yes gene_type:complete
MSHFIEFSNDLVNSIPEEIVELIIEFSQCKHCTKCHLSGGRCCECLDTRPNDATYNVYFDGVGFIKKNTKTRQDMLFERTRHYCPACVRRIYFPFI